MTITRDCNDIGKLHSTAALAAETLGVQSLGVIADKGYESGKDILSCLENGIVPDVGFCYDREQRVFSLEYIPAHVTSEQRAAQRPKDIRACLHAGVLPDCYANTNISLSLQQQQKLRMQVSEHPFGTIKHSDNADHFLRRGFEKVRAETALMFLRYNIRRAVSIAGGVQKLIALWNGIAAPKCQNGA